MEQNGVPPSPCRLHRFVPFRDGAEEEEGEKHSRLCKILMFFTQTGHLLAAAVAVCII